MDCVRVSTREANGKKYDGGYIENLPLHSAGRDACRQACVSNLSCKAWEYSSDRKCFLAKELYGPHPSLINTPPGGTTGLIECENDWSMLKLIWWVVILGLILVGVWYVINRCEPRARARNQSFLPNLRFSN